MSYFCIVLMKLVENGKGKIVPPEREDKSFMNFIR
jgi:hypothetical protein